LTLFGRRLKTKLTDDKLPKFEFTMRDEASKEKSPENSPLNKKTLLAKLQRWQKAVCFFENTNSHEV
jgi:hypothetical protein